MCPWTEAQQKAIETRGENLLVSAAAGSGKTAVLSARVVDFVASGHSLDRLLIVTFTNAAAAEMRSRIARDLAAKSAENPSDAHLRRQSLTLYKAKICTIDSYGMDLLRRNFQQAGISPDFTVLDETELDVIKSAVLQRMMEEYYRTIPQGFSEFESLFGGELNSRTMETAISSVARKMESFPFADQWLEDQKARLSGADAWCRAACDAVFPILEEYRNIFAQILDNFPFSDKKLDQVREEHLLLTECCAALERGDWDEVCRRVRGHKFATSPSVKDTSPREAWLYKEYRNRLKSFFNTELIFTLSSRQCEEDLTHLRPGLEFLFDAVHTFRKQVREEMDKRSAYSFSALAEMALHLTVKEYSHKTGEFTPSKTALQERSHYEEVLIDEYQDVNDLQDLFFRAVSDNNCFAVGDIKQSIYGFRGSNSENFLRKKETCNVIALNKNFRSRKGILDFVNFLCRGLFTRDLGGICYDEEEMLFAGRPEDEASPYPIDQTPSPNVELLLLPTAGQRKTLHYREEALLCAKLIRDAVEGGATVFDKETKSPRPMRYSDVAILMRAMSSTSLYEEVFREWGIPLLSSDGETFLDSPSVCGVLAFLQAIDDPWDDMALFVTLTGSVFSLSAEEVALARLKKKQGALWEGLVEYAKENPRANHALHTLQKFRILAENLPLPKLIWEVYTATDYLALESATDPSARSNLMKFYAFARRYSANNGLFDFLEFTQRAKDVGKVKESGSAPDGDFVRLMTIHKSKGLEYAWCIIPELERTGRENNDSVRVDKDFGVAPKVKNESGTAEYTTLMRELIHFRSDRNEVAEELRVLYVALTRPRDRLTMISRCSDKLEKLDLHGLHSEQGIVRLIDRLEMNSFRAPVLDRTVAHPDAKIIQSAWLAPESEEGHLRVDFGEIPEEVPPAKTTQKTRCNLSDEELNRRFSFAYNNRLSTVPAKVSVTEISKSPADPDSELLLREPPVSKPGFLSKELTGAEAGTAIHTYCQFADFDRPVEEEIARLLNQGHLTQEGAAALNRKDLEQFLQSDLMQRLRTSLGYQREVRFTCRIPVSYYTGNPGDEGEMLLQGAMDLLWETEEGYWIVDFKSDRASEEELLQRYSRQLNLYAAAVRRLYDKPVLGCNIWAFRLGKALTVKEEEL